MAQRIETSDPSAVLTDDRALTLAFQRGDKGAYQAIHDRHHDRVMSVCRRMLGNPHDVEEAAQETFLRVYQALPRFNGRYQMKAWVTRIATNVCLDHLRARSRKPADLEPFDAIELLDSDQDHEADPQELHLRRTEGRRVRKVLASLPPLHRAAIVLRDFEGLSYAEVAIALDLTECQVKALIHRARRRFKRTWAEGAAGLLPWRLLDRFRGGDGARPAAEAVAQAGQTAVACSGVLQQCSSYVSQHVATALTAAVVGTAAGAAGHAAVTHVPDKDASPAILAEATPSAASGKVAAAPRRPSRVKKATRQGLSAIQPDEASDDPAPADTPPDEPSDPTPTPTSPPSPSEEPTPTAPSPTPEDPPSAPAPPFAPAAGFDWGNGVTPRRPEAHELALDCDRGSFAQRLNTSVDDDDSPVTYPAAFLLNFGNAAAPSGDLSLELWVTKNGQRVYYRGTGRILDGSNSGTNWKVSFSGQYSTDDPAAARMDLPVSGGFSATLELDCARLSVVTESVVLGT